MELNINLNVKQNYKTFRKRQEKIFRTFKLDTKSKIHKRKS